jgi:DNA-binding CsgD family transcriptional regulator
VTAPGPDPLAEGRAALRRGDAVTARRLLSPLAAGDGEQSGDVVESLARCAYLELDYPSAIEAWERAYGMHRAAGAGAAAIRVARMLAYMYGSFGGQWAVASGWLARAQTLLGEPHGGPGGEDGAEAGWVDLTAGMFEPDRRRKDARFRSALAAAREAGDSSLEVLSLAYLGASLVYMDHTEEGMVLLDEAMAALAGHEVDDFSVLEQAFCQLFSACEHAHDVGRAEEWIRVGEAVAERRRLPVVSAFCRTHYGAVLTAAGRWPEAEATLTEAIRLWGLGQRSGLRSSALTRLADLRARQGRFEEAEHLLTGLEGEVEAARPLAAALLARNEPEVAGEVLERALAQLDDASSSTVPLRALLVDVHLAAGRVDEAAATAAELVDVAKRHPGNDYLRAVAALARGRVCLAKGDGDPRGCLREALAGFSRAQMPVELARSRLELANVLLDERPEVALAEARAALEAFDRLQAARDADAAAATLRRLGVRTATTARPAGRTSTGAGARAGVPAPTPLTTREAEVLELLGHGLSNPEIAERLYISRKTVEHHVGNVLAKLGLRSRAEAAAYAARRGPAGE